MSVQIFLKSGATFCMALMLASCSSAPRVTGYSDAPVVDFCELFKSRLSRPDEVVRVVARYRVGFEYAFLESKSCKGRVWVEFDPDYALHSDPALVRKLRRLLSQDTGESYGSYTLKVQVVGRFHGRKQTYEPIPGLLKERGYGHMGGYEAELSVLSLEAVSSVFEL